MKFTWRNLLLKELILVWLFILFLDAIHGNIVIIEKHVASSLSLIN